MSRLPGLVQKRKYKEPNDQVFVEFKEHLLKLKHEFHPRYYVQQTTYNNKDEFDLISVIHGKSLLLAKHKKTGKYFTIKVISKSFIVANKRISELKEEKRIATSVRFIFISHMEYCLKDNANIYFVFPYTSSEDLFSLLKRVRAITERDVKFYGAQVLLALEYLHNLDIIHRNLKPENIHLTTNGYIKLGDFRFAKLIPMRTYSFCGTPEYMAPEIVLNKGYGKSVDWWAYGVLLYEMIAGYTPFFSSDPMKIYENILDGKIRYNRNFSNNGKNLISNILEIEISKRYGNLLNESLDIKCHEWFEIIEWQKIYRQTITPPFYPERLMPTQDDPQKLLSIVSSFKSDTCEYEKEFDDF